jgi:adenosylcobinamide amidohydrolase
MDWEVLAKLPKAAVRRRGRFIVVDLIEDHRVITTSAINGGEVESLRHLVNHQCCEGKDHDDRFHLIVAKGDEFYHGTVCAEIGLPPTRTAMMATAANMNYAACAARRDADVEVLAIVTAGVETNAVCAGDPASSRETSEGVVSAIPVGTINTILLSNVPLARGALARTVITMAEAKSAALQRLAVPSCYSSDLATGTGTDQYCVAAPLEGGRTLKSASPHMKFGEIVGLAVRDATLEALRWQNGLEASYTRGLFRALGRYGIKESTIYDRLAPLLEAGSLELLRKNNASVLYEPLVGAAAHATAAVLDRARFGTLPPALLRDAIVQQAASLAASLAAKPDRWPAFRAVLHAAPVAEPIELIVHAIALGWSEKWKA